MYSQGLLERVKLRILVNKYSYRWRTSFDSYSFRLLINLIAIVITLIESLQSNEETGT